MLATRERKDAALREMAAALRERSEEIVKANTADLEAGRAAGLPENMLDRLTLNEQRIGGVADGLLTVAGLADPVGEVLRGGTAAQRPGHAPGARPARAWSAWSTRRGRT